MISYTSFHGKTYFFTSATEFEFSTNPNDHRIDGMCVNKEVMAAAREFARLVNYDYELAWNYWCVACQPKADAQRHGQE